MKSNQKLITDLRAIAEQLDRSDGWGRAALSVRAAMAEIEPQERQDEVHWKTRRTLLMDIERLTREREEAEAVQQPPAHPWQETEIERLRAALKGLLAEVEVVVQSAHIPSTWLDDEQPDLAIVNARSALQGAGTEGKTKG